MALAYRLYVGVVTALILCHYSLAEWNATEDEQGNSTVALHHQGNSNNFTEDLNETQTDGESGGRIIKCPLEFQHYCIHGSCQFYEALDSPSCSCNPGYTGYRCELFDLGWQVTDQRQIIVACVITALVFMILLIVFICICAHRHKICRRKRRRKQEAGNVSEKHKMNIMKTNGKHSSALIETTDTFVV